MRKSLLLNGFMATGKSSVGRQLARDNGVEFVDLDLEVERRAGASVRQIFESDGETVFRALETAALDALLGDGKLRVVALGGGALLRRTSRLAAMDRAVVVCLEASVEELIKRVGGQPQSRPLLGGGDVRARIEQLLELRAPGYAECHAKVVTTGRGMSEIVQEINGLWSADPVGVAAGEQSYCVEVGREIVQSGLAKYLLGATRIILVTDNNVGPLHANKIRRAMPNGIPVETVVLSAGEEHKTLASTQLIWERASAVGADRSTVFVGLGGGVVTDITGFAAAGWMRGVAWVGIPTTLLSMVDASVGGKTAVDLGRAKNCVGAFWQPRHVFCDITLSATEPARGRTALSEVVKTAIIGDSELFSLLEDKASLLREGEPETLVEVVARCVRVKARVVGIDAREAGVRAHLNLGHTVGHALEAVAGFDRLSHGEAVSLGIVAALRIGEKLGVTPNTVSERVIRLLRDLELPTDLSCEPLGEATKLLGLDKKRRGSAIRFITVAGLGQIEMQDLEIRDLASLSQDLS